MPSNEKSEIIHEEEAMVISSIETREPETEGLDSDPFYDQEGKDWLLTHMVFCAESYGISQPVTLYMNGSIVTGTVITGKDFFKRYLQLLTNGLEIQDGSTADEVRYIGDQMYGGDPKTIQIETFKPLFIHLGNARVFIGAQEPIPAEGMVWRGRLSEVAGFNPGTFTVAQ